MEQMETIADYNAEQFIKKHFSNLSKNDQMVRLLKRSVKDTIRKALETYDAGKFNDRLI
ncbi:MAG: hypothetical protein ACNA7V_11210 [Bacteroidales bacterium]